MAETRTKQGRKGKKHATTKRVKRVVPKRKKAPVKRPSKPRKSRGNKTLQKVPDPQGITEKRGDVGYKRPPKEYQFQAGQSGNPEGPGKKKSNLWYFFSRYLHYSDYRFAKLRTKRLTQAQRIALRVVEQFRKGGMKGNGAHVLIDCFNRDEGKPTEHVRVGPEDRALTQQECEEIRQEMVKGDKA